MIAHIGEVEDDQVGGTGDPVGGFAGVNDERFAFLMDVLFVRMAVNHQVVCLNFCDFRDVMVGVGHVNAFATYDVFIAIFVNFTPKTVNN